MLIEIIKEMSGDWVECWGGLILLGWGKEEEMVEKIEGVYSGEGR